MVDANREPWQPACGAETLSLRAIGDPRRKGEWDAMCDTVWTCSRNVGHDGAHCSEWHGGSRTMWFDEPFVVEFTLPVSPSPEGTET